MEFGLAGKNAIITGGSAGIGLSCAKALVSEGANVMIIGRDRVKLEHAVNSLRDIDEKCKVIAISEDLTSPSAAERIGAEAISQFGKIDILINNAGSAKAGSFWDLSDQDFLDAWTLKLLGYIRMVKAVAPYMMKEKQGRILNIVGTGGKTPSPTFLPGGTANAALLNFTKGISKELAGYGIRINVISPAITATERAETLALQEAEANGISVEEQKALTNAKVPLGQVVQPEEIAYMALLLVSDLIPSITGTEIAIDGGLQAGI